MKYRFTGLTIVLLLAVAATSTGPAVALPEIADEQGHAHATHGPDGLALDRRGRVPGATYSIDNHQDWNSCEYDTMAFPTDQEDLPALKTLPQVHAVYVYPARTSPRFTAFAAMFQADARQASSLLQGQGRDIRWDQRPGKTTCTGTSQDVTLLDITVFQSSYNAKQLATDRQFTLVANELEASGKFSAPQKKYIVWLDAGSRYCGQGSLWQDRTRSSNNLSETNRTTGIVYRPYATGDGKTGGFCRGRTLLHELGHTLGAVQNVASNAFDGAHCDDDNNDVMCYTGQASDQISSPTPQLDYGKNDYWDAGATKTTAGDDGYPGLTERLNWWALNLSKYICPPGPEGTVLCGSANSTPGF